MFKDRVIKTFDTDKFKKGYIIDLIVYRKTVVNEDLITFYSSNHLLGFIVDCTPTNLTVLHPDGTVREYGINQIYIDEFDYNQDTMYQVVSVGNKIQEVD